MGGFLQKVDIFAGRLGIGLENGRAGLGADK
jgi:hypothetical protein